MKQAEIINYFDVWGNQKDGWEVNNMCSEGNIELPENYSHKDILKALRDASFLKKGVGLNRVIVEDLHPYYEISQKKDLMPVCRIQILED